MAAVNSTATVIPTATKLNNLAFATPHCRRFLRFSSPSLRRSKFTPLTASSDEAAKIEQKEAAPDVITSAKAFAEATKAAVIEQGDAVKDKLDEAADDTKANVIEQGDNFDDKVSGAVGDILEATNTSVAEAQGSLNQTSSPKDKKE